jgi:REP element-mobilizing transposase RayT
MFTWFWLLNIGENASIKPCLILYRAIVKVSQTMGMQLLEFNREPDHVHLLSSMNPKVSPFSICE